MSTILGQRRSAAHAHARVTWIERRRDIAHGWLVTRIAASTAISRARSAVIGRVTVLLAILVAAALLVALGVTLSLGATAGQPLAPAVAAPASVAAPAPAVPAPAPAVPAAAVPLPAPALAPAQLAAPAPTATHRVGKGETLAAIGLRYQVPFAHIAERNRLANPNHIKVGQLLVIPPQPAGVAVIAAGATPASVAAVHGMTVAQLVALNPQLRRPGGFLAGGQLRLSR